MHSTINQLKYGKGRAVRAIKVLGVVSIDHTALGYASCCMAISTAPLIPLLRVQHLLLCFKYAFSQVTYIHTCTCGVGCWKLPFSSFCIFPLLVCNAHVSMYSVLFRKDQTYTGNIISNASFSKVFAPGLRLGWLEAPARVRDIIMQRCVWRDISIQCMIYYGSCRAHTEICEPCNGLCN